MMADEFNFLRPEIKNYKAEADADLIIKFNSYPKPIRITWQMQMWCLLSTCFCAPFVADLIVGMEELELHYRRRCRSNLRKIKIATISVRMVLFLRTSSTTTRDRNLQFRGAVSTGGSPLDFCFFSSIYVRFSNTSPPKPGESSEKSSGENRVKKSVTSVAVMVFFGPEFQLFLKYVFALWPLPSVLI